MSTTIDQRVVEMRFDNQHFEKNVSTTMSTLEKLKQSLNLTGASKGLEGINTAAKNNNMGVLSNAVESVGVKFSAMQIAGITALSRLTNSAITAGARITKALTIDPITTGFSEYELKMGSIQTIMASTGASLDEVNGYLNELNEYSDKTIYSFSDMTQNIGKFTNAGVKLEDAVMAIKGISNEAAISGANANEASRAMYNFAQALSAGYVKLIDWKSIELANMATVGFKEELIATAVAAGTLTKTSDGMYKTLEGNVLSATKNFNETLQDQWMTSEVLITTLKNYADETTEIGAKATQAATEVKTFTQMMDALKESAQSGWAQSWEIIFGDFNEGKTLWTGMYKSIGAVIDKMSEARNTFLKSVFWEPWELAAEKVNEAGIETSEFKTTLLETANEMGLLDDEIKKITDDEERFTKALKKGKITKDVVIKTLKKYTEGIKGTSKTQDDLTEKLKKFQKIVDEVWIGTYGNGQKRVEALTKAGYDYAEVQELVNKCTNGYRLKLEDLSDSQLKSIGYTDEQVKAIRKLAEEAETSGTDFNELIESLSRPSGRELILATVNNLLTQFKELSDEAKEAWDNVFGDNDGSGSVYDLIEQLHKLSEEFDITEEQAEQFKNILQGALSAVELTWNITGLGMRAGLKILCAVLELFGTDLLSVAEAIANMITEFNEWAQKNTIWWGYINNLAKIIHAFAQGIYDCIKAVLGLEVIGDIFDKVWGWISKLFGGIDYEATAGNIEKVVDTISGFFTNLAEKIKGIDDLEFNISWESFEEFITFIKSKLPTLDGVKKTFENVQTKISDFFKWLNKLRDSDSLGKDIVTGIVNGITSGFSGAIEAIKNLGNIIIGAFCELLGIQSPSKVFIAIGGFIIAGLIYGLQDSANFLFSSIGSIVSHMFTISGDAIQNGIPFIVDLVKTLGSKMLGALKETEIDFGALFVAGSLVAVAFFMKKILDVLEKLTSVTSPLKSLAEMLDGVKDLLGEFQKNVKAKRILIYAEALKSVAISIAILAGVFVVLSKIEYNRNSLYALGVMTALIAGMGALMFAAQTLKPEAFGKLSLFALAMSASLWIMATAIKRLVELDPDRANVAIYQFAALIMGMAGLLAVYGQFVKGKAAMNVDKAGMLIGKMALAVGVMALVIKLIAGMSGEEIIKGLAFIGGIELLFAGIIAVSQFSGKHADKAAKLIGKMAIAIGIAALAMKLIATMSMSDIGKGLIALAGMTALFSAVIYLSEFVGKNAGKAGLMFLGMSIAIGALALSLKIIGTMSSDDITKGIHFITAALSLFGSIMILSEFVGDNAGKAGRMFLGMGVAIGILAITIRLLTSISNEDILRGMAIVAGFELLFGAIIWVSKFAGEHADKAGQMLQKMSISILIMVAAIAVLSLLKPEKIAVATAAISAIMVCFSALILASSTLGNNTDKIAGKLITMAVIIGALAGVIALLSTMNPENVIASAGSLSVLLLTLAGAMAILSHIKVSMASVGIMALLGLVMVELAGVLWIMNKLNIQPSIDSCAGLVILLAGMAGVCYIMSGLGPVALSAATGIVAFGILIAELAVVFAGLGALYQIPGMQDFISDGGNLLQAVGTAIGQFVGGLLGGIAAGATSSLPVIGTHLTDFWNNVSDFVEGVKTIDSSVASGMMNLAGAILILTGAGILDGLTAWATGGSSFATFADDLKPFGTGIKEFAAEVEGINGESVAGALDVAKSLIEIADIIPNSGGLAGLLAGNNDIGDFGLQLSTFGYCLKAYSDSVAEMGDNQSSIDASIKAAEALAKLAEHLPNMGGLFSFFTGDTNLTAFGTQLVSFGTSLNQFAANLGTFDESKVTSIKCAADAIKVLSQAGSEINGQAEWSKALFGDNSIATFGAQLPSLASNLNLFATNLGAFDDTKVSTVKCAVNAIKAMAQAGSEINGQAEWSKALFGDNSLAAFGEKLPGIATNLSTFATNLGTFDDAKVATVKCAANAIKSMAQAAQGIDGQAEWSKKLFGDNGLATFGDEMADLGTDLKTFVSNLGTFSEAQVSTVKSAVSAVKAFAKLADANLESAKTNLPGFGVILPNFAVNLSTFCTGMPATESINTAVTNIKNIVSMVKEIASAKTTNVTEFTSALGEMGTAGVEAFVTAFTSASAKTDVKQAAADLMEQAVKGAESKKDAFKTAAETVAKAGASAIKGQSLYDSFYSAGGDLGDGLVDGIEAKYDDAYNAGYKLGQKAVQGEKDGQESNSPSKATRKAGHWIGEGLVLGIADMSEKVYGAGQNLGKYATDSMSKAVSKITSVINTDIDTQPTIRPVLDLSDVESGVGALSGMLNMGSTVPVAANVGAISAMRNGRIQNGGNDDVVSAIDRLRGALGNIGGPTYNIDGVTYDDGTNISDAVKALVRAAKIDRRT